MSDFCKRAAKAGLKCRPCFSSGKVCDIKGRVQLHMTHDTISVYEREPSAIEVSTDIEVVSSYAYSLMNRDILDKALAKTAKRLRQRGFKITDVDIHENWDREYDPEIVPFHLHVIGEVPSLPEAKRLVDAYQETINPDQLTDLMKPRRGQHRK